MKKDFLWGASTSAYQVEGGWNEDGKGLSVQDIKKVSNTISDFKTAVDHYHAYKEDIELFRELGLRAYRFSISWARILPAGTGEINQQGIEFYNKLINELLAAHIEPIVTMYHFDLPAELEKKGGWNNRETIAAFEEYCAILFENFSGRVKYWLTINEQNMMILASSAVLEGKKELQQSFQESHHMFVAQAKVIANFHKNYRGKIGPAPNIAFINPATDAPEDNLAAQNFSALRNWLFLDVPIYGVYNHQAQSILEQLEINIIWEDGDAELLKAGIADFIGLNYYTTNTVSAFFETVNKDGDQQSGFDLPNYFQSKRNTHLEKTEFGWEIDPIGFRLTLHEVYSRYRLPILITENGIGGEDYLKNGEIQDNYRITYLRRHIKQMEQAIKEGVSVLGYCPWSVLDLVSTHEGMKKRYGFIYVNRTDTELLDLKRYKKASFYWYQQVIRNGGLEDE